MMAITRQKHPRRGFGSMTPERIKEIATLGGKAAQAQGVAHKWNTKTAKQACRKRWGKT